MIERKDVRHDIPKEDSLYVKDILSYVYVTEISNVKANNEEAIRRKLYGDVVDELKIMQDFAERCEQSVEQLILVGRFYDLIDKLEWRDTDGT